MRCENVSSESNGMAQLICACSVEARGEKNRETLLRNSLVLEVFVMIQRDSNLMALLGVEKAR